MCSSKVHRLGILQCLGSSGLSVRAREVLGLGVLPWWQQCLQKKRKSALVSFLVIKYEEQNNLRESLFLAHYSRHNSVCRGIEGSRSLKHLVTLHMRPEERGNKCMHAGVQHPFPFLYRLRSQLRMWCHPQWAVFLLHLV